MGYIGRTPAYGNFEKDNHTGDGITSQFNLTYPVASPTQLLVSLDGVIQEPDYSYNVTMVSGQGKINFSEAPDIGARIFIVYVGRQLLTAGSNAPSTYLDEFNGDNSTVSFTLTRTPATTDAANFIVYVDNIYQREGSSYAFTISGETITFTSAPPTGTNNIQVYQLSLSNEVNTVSDGTVTEAKLANGAVTEAKIADNAVTENKLGTDVQDRLYQIDSTSGHKNLVIGGNFSTNPWQRGDLIKWNDYVAGQAPLGAHYINDGWERYGYYGGFIQISKDSDAPTYAECGVVDAKSMKIELENNDVSYHIATPSSLDFMGVGHRIEGNNIKDLAFGQSGTRYLTLSFWVKSNVPTTGSDRYHVSFKNAKAWSASTRSYLSPFEITAADTWEKKTITLPVDTTGTWQYDENLGLAIDFMLLSGGNYNQAATTNAWFDATTSGDTTPSTQINFFEDVTGSSGSNYLKIALVQLERGQTATAFEQRSKQQELLLCSRYYHGLAKRRSVEQSMGMATAYTANNLYLLDHPPVEMRVVPEMDQYLGNPGTNNFRYYAASASLDFRFFTSVNLAATTKTYSIYLSTAGLLAQGQSGMVRTLPTSGITNETSTSSWFGLSAEL